MQDQPVLIAYGICPKGKREVLGISVSWQRCQFHLQQNAQAYAPKQSMKKEVAADIRHIVNAPSLDESKRLLAATIGKYEKTATKLSEWLEGSIPERLQVF